MGVEDGFQFRLYPPQTEQAHTWREVGQQVHITIRLVLSSGHAAEHPKISHAIRSGHRDQFPPHPAYPAPYWPG